MIVGGLDLGTTGCKISLYNEQAELLHTYYKEYESVHKNGQHEIDFNDVKNGFFSLLKSAVKEYRIDALGITGFGETFAMLDENDNILAPTMLYTDPRGEEECKKICELMGEENLTLKTGVKPHSMYSISKILWYKNNRKDVFSKCKRILLSEDFIVYTLTGNAQIDYSLAARTGAFDIEKKCWITEIFDALKVNVSFMSVPVAAGSIAGVVKAELKNELGIDYDITVVNGCHDQIAAMIGAGVFSRDNAMDGTGTVECIPVVLEKKPDNIDFYEYGYSVVPYIDNMFACYALSYTGGATLKWFRDNFAKDKSYKQLDQQVEDEPSGILVMPHFAGGANPYMDNGSKAAMIGLTLEHTYTDIYKALMEGVTYEIMLNIEHLENFGIVPQKLYATGGGSYSDVWLQIKADILNRTIISLDAPEAGTCGTCMMVGVAVGVYKDLYQAKNIFVKEKKTFIPNPDTVKKYQQYYNAFKDIYKVVRPIVEKIDN